MSGLPPAGLTRKAVGAGTSLAVMTGVERALILARALVLARLLEPHEFGLMGMAFVAINMAEVLSQTGFGPALVQRDDNPRPFMDTFWVVSVARGVGLAFVLVLLSYPIGAYFNTPEVVPVLQTLSVAMILRGFLSPAWFALQRDLHLFRFAVPSAVGALIDFIVTTWLAFELRSVWAMVYGFLIGSLVLVVMTYVAGPFLPRFRISLHRARALYSFGKHIFAQDVLTTLTQQFDKLIVGRLRSTADLGLFTFANRLATLPTTTIYQVVFRVVFPAFARIQNDPERIRRAFRKFISLMAVAAFPVATGLLVTAPELISVAFGKKWIPMTVTFQFLCILGLSRSLENSFGAVASSIGHPVQPVQASLIRLVILVTAMIPATRIYGIEGAAAVTAGGTVASSLYLWFRSSRTLGVALGFYRVAFGIPAVASLAMVLVVQAIRVSGPDLPALARLAFIIAGGAMSYVVVTIIIDRLTGGRLRNTVRTMISPR